MALKHTVNCLIEANKAEKSQNKDRTARDAGEKAVSLTVCQSTKVPTCFPVAISRSSARLSLFFKRFKKQFAPCGAKGTRQMKISFINRDINRC